MTFGKIEGMESQTSFAQSEFAAKKKRTRRERFLAEMETAVPWARLAALIEPSYLKGERGRPPVGVERMLQVYIHQQWYSLADEALEDALYDSRAMRGFVGGDLVPDATTLLKFRHLLEAHGLRQHHPACHSPFMTRRAEPQNLTLTTSETMGCGDSRNLICCFSWNENFR